MSQYIKQDTRNGLEYVSFQVRAPEGDYGLAFLESLIPASLYGSRISITMQHTIGTRTEHQIDIRFLDVQEAYDVVSFLKEAGYAGLAKDITAALIRYGHKIPPEIDWLIKAYSTAIKEALSSADIEVVELHLQRSVGGGNVGGKLTLTGGREVWLPKVINLTEVKYWVGRVVKVCKEGQKV
jgi:hypothetical protein